MASESSPTLNLLELSERFAHSTRKAGDKPALQCFGWVATGGTFFSGLAYTPERVRVKTLELILYEPGDDNEPVRLGSVTVRLKNHLLPCGPGAMHAGLELEIIRATD